MKKMIFVLFAIFAFASVSKAQVSDQVTVNLILHPVMSIEINPTSGGDVVDIEYKTKADYENGVEVNRPGHLKIFSNTAFKVQMSTNNTGFIPVNGGSPQGGNIEVNKVNVTPYAGSNASNLTMTPAPLSTTSTTIVSGNSAMNAEVGIRYKGADQNFFFGKLNDSNPSRYTTLVTYAITAP